VPRCPASDLIRSAIRADMEARIESVAIRLEAESESWGGTDDIVPAIEAALTEVTGIVAAGLVARIRETSPARA
jgi:hypothetical protein